MPYPKKAPSLGILFLLPFLCAALATAPASAANEAPASATADSKTDGLARSWQKLLPWLYPSAGADAPGEAIGFTVHAVSIPALPDNADLPPLRVRWTPGGERFEIRGTYEGTTYAIGRRDDTLWLFDPKRDFGVIGKPDVPLFPKLADLRRPVALPVLQPPMPLEQAAMLPQVVRRTSLGDARIRGAAARGVRLELPENARSMFGLPPVSLEYWFRKSDHLPARLVYHDGDQRAYRVEFADYNTPGTPATVGAPPDEAAPHLRPVALYHLRRMTENLLDPPEKRDIPKLGPAEGDITTVATAGRGKLERHDGVRVLYLQGTPEEMGRQHGELLGPQVRAVVDRLVYGVGITSSFPKGRWFFDEIEEARSRASRFVDDRYHREMDALADASGLHRAEIHVANYFPELFHCSGFALFGDATADGRLYHGRILDYLRGMGLEQNAVVTVLRPDGRNAWVNLGYAGFLGSVTAMNEHGVAIGEMGGTSPGHWDGMPMAQLVREVMETTETVDEAVELMRETPRTCEYYYVISDGKTNDAVGIRATPDTFETVRPQETHRLLPEHVPDAVLLSAGERYDHLVRRVRERYGDIGAESAWELMDRPVALGSNIQTALFRPETLDFWVANAGPDAIATRSRSTRFNLGDLLDRMPE